MEKIKRAMMADFLSHVIWGKYKIDMKEIGKAVTDYLGEEKEALPQPDVSGNEAIQPENKKGEVAVLPQTEDEWNEAHEAFVTSMKIDERMTTYAHLQRAFSWFKERYSGKTDH